MRELRVPFFLTGFILGLFSPSTAQETTKPPKNNGTFYFAWGYNKDWFSRSDIHFEDHITDDYDFIVHDAAAHDSPMLNYIFDKDIAIPQYCYRLGYFFNDNHNLGIEISFDHAKYIMTDLQHVHITGHIREEHFDKDTTIGGYFLNFEHTNGANFLTLNLLKRQTFYESKNKKHFFDFIAKAGGGVVVPKTEVYLMGKDVDNCFHVAGYIFGAEAAVRWHFLKSFFVEPAFKGVFANYTNVLAIGHAHANHSFFAAETILTAGFQINIGGSKSAGEL